MCSHHKIDFEQFIVSLFQPESFVRLSRCLILRVHVQPQSADVLSPLGQCVNVIEQRAKNSSAPELLGDIDALDPPEIPIPPIAPLVGDQQLSRHGDGSVLLALGQKVGAFSRMAQQRGDSLPHTFRVQAPVLRFPGHPRVEPGHDSGIRQFSFSNFDLDGLRYRAWMIRFNCQLMACSICTRSIRARSRIWCWITWPRARSAAFSRCALFMAREWAICGGPSMRSSRNTRK